MVSEAALKSLIPDATERPVISVPEAGRLLGLSKDTAYRAAHAGEIPTLRIGRKILVPTATLLKLLGIES